jgi:hypothetical protein
MVKAQVSQGRVYKSELDGCCINCGKKSQELNDVSETTYVFEHCSSNKILKQVEDHLTSIGYDGETIKFSITIAEEEN